MPCDMGIRVEPQVEHAEKIAVLRANGLGDYLFAEPALASLKAAYPSAELVLLGAPWHAEVLAHRPGPVDRIEVVPPAPGIRDPAPGEGGFARAETLDTWSDRLSGETFDLAVQMHGGGGSSNPLVRALGARLSVGLASEDAEPLDRTLPYNYFQPEVVRFLELAALAGAAPLRLDARWPVTQADRIEALDLLGEVSEIAVLAPGAGDGRRRWAAASFARLGDALAAEGLCIAVTGTEAESRLVTEVRAAMRAPSLDLSGRLTIGRLAATLERARIVVANDSGTLHLARAVGAPTVGVYWCGNLINAGPLVNRRHRVVLSWRLDCPTCGSNCMQEGCTHDASFVSDAPVQEVLGQALDLLGTCRPVAAATPVMAGTASR